MQHKLAASFWSGLKRECARNHTAEGAKACAAVPQHVQERQGFCCFFKNPALSSVFDPHLHCDREPPAVRQRTSSAVSRQASAEPCRALVRGFAGSRIVTASLSGRHFPAKTQAGERSGRLDGDMANLQQMPQMQPLPTPQAPQQQPLHRPPTTLSRARDTALAVVRFWLEHR